MLFVPAPNVDVSEEPPRTPAKENTMSTQTTTNPAIVEADAALIADFTLVGA